MTGSTTLLLFNKTRTRLQEVSLVPPLNQTSVVVVSHFTDVFVLVPIADDVEHVTQGLLGFRFSTVPLV